MDASLAYKLVNRSSGHVLGAFGSSNYSGAWLTPSTDNNGNPTASQRWHITTNHDGYFCIESLNPGSGGTSNVLDNSNSTTAGVKVVQWASNGGWDQEWDVVSVADGYFHLVNRLSGMALDVSGGYAVQQSAGTDYSQQWQIVPSH